MVIDLLVFSKTESLEVLSKACVTLSQADQPFPGRLQAQHRVGILRDCRSGMLTWEVPALEMHYFATFGNFSVKTDSKRNEFCRGKDFDFRLVTSLN